MFMDKESIRECILNLKVKNSAGFDHIPQRIIVDGVDQLTAQLGGLFNFYSNFIQLFKYTGFQRGNADEILLS